MRSKLLIYVANKKGEWFGEISFFSGERSCLNVRSVDFSKVLKIRRDDFQKLIMEDKKELEKFCMIQDKIRFSNDLRKMFIKCHACGDITHKSKQCQFLHFIPQKFKVLALNNISEPVEERKKISRNCLPIGGALELQNLVNESALEYIQDHPEEILKYEEDNLFLKPGIQIPMSNMFDAALGESKEFFNLDQQINDQNSQKTNTQYATYQDNKRKYTSLSRQGDRKKSFLKKRSVISTQYCAQVLPSIDELLLETDLNSVDDKKNTSYRLINGNPGINYRQKPNVGATESSRSQSKIWSSENLKSYSSEANTIKNPTKSNAFNSEKVIISKETDGQEYSNQCNSIMVSSADSIHKKNNFYDISDRYQFKASRGDGIERSSLFFDEGIDLMKCPSESFSPGKKPFMQFKKQQSMKEVKNKDFSQENQHNRYVNGLMIQTALQQEGYSFEDFDLLKGKFECMKIFEFYFPSYNYKQIIQNLSSRYQRYLLKNHTPLLDIRASRTQSNLSGFIPIHRISSYQCIKKSKTMKEDKDLMSQKSLRKSSKLRIGSQLLESEKVNSPRRKESSFRYMLDYGEDSVHREKSPLSFSRKEDETFQNFQKEPSIDIIQEMVPDEPNTPPRNEIIVQKDISFLSCLRNTHFNFGITDQTQSFYHTKREGFQQGEDFNEGADNFSIIDGTTSQIQIES